MRLTCLTLVCILTLAAGSALAASADGTGRYLVHMATPGPARIMTQRLSLPVKSPQEALQLRESALDDWRQVVEDARVGVTAALTKAGSVKGSPLFGVRVVRTYSLVPALVVEADPQQATALGSLPGVDQVRPEEIRHLSLASSLKYLHAADFWNVDGTGEGASVAVLDTGVEFYSTDFFGTCTHAGDEGCAVVAELNFGGQDGPAPSNHGTITCGIVHGVAPGADIISLDVFTYMGSSDYGASDSDILDALNWVLDNRTRYNIAGVNMSLGSGLYDGFCAGWYRDFSDVFEGLWAVGTPVAVASGNDGATQRVSFPACIYPAVAVGACGDAGDNAGDALSFSNQSPILAFMAPGGGIEAGGLAGASGTSMAAPHVAGAFALVSAALQKDGPYTQGLSDDILRNLLIPTSQSTASYVDYPWTWASLNLEPIAGVSQLQVVSYAQSRRLNAGEGIEADMEVAAEEATGVERVVVMVDVAGSEGEKLTLTLTAPDGTTYSTALPDSAVGDGRMVLGTFLVPELTRAFKDCLPQGRWHIALDYAANANNRITIYSLAVAIDPQGNDPVALLKSSIDPTLVDLTARQVPVDITLYSHSITPRQCSATVTMTPAAGGEAREQSDEVNVLHGNQVLTMQAPLPQDLVAGLYAMRFTIDCDGGAVIPDHLEDSLALTFGDLSVRNFKLDRSIIKPDSKVAPYRYTISSPAAWAVPCTETLADPESDQVYLTREVAVTLPDQTLTGSFPVEGIWANGQQRQVTVSLSCAPHGVANVAEALAFTMVEPPLAKIVAAPGLTGEAPYTLTLKAEVTGLAETVKWTFGDGTTGQGLELSHTYDTIGSYGVILAVSNAAGSQSVNATVQVTPKQEEPKPTPAKGGCQGGGGVSSFGALFLLASWVITRRRPAARARLGK